MQADLLFEQEGLAMVAQLRGECAPLGEPEWFFTVMEERFQLESLKSAIPS